MTVFVLVLGLVPLALVARGTWAVWRFARLPRQAKRNYPAALWARWRWRWLTHNLGLTYEDKHRRRRLRPAVRHGGQGRRRRPRPGEAPPPAGPDPR